MSGEEATIYQDFADRLTAIADTISTAIANDTIELIDWGSVSQSLVEEVRAFIGDDEVDTNDDDAPSIRYA